MGTNIRQGNDFLNLLIPLLTLQGRRISAGIKAKHFTSKSFPPPLDFQTFLRRYCTELQITTIKLGRRQARTAQHGVEFDTDLVAFICSLTFVYIFRNWFFLYGEATLLLSEGILKALKGEKSSSQKYTVIALWMWWKKYLQKLNTLILIESTCRR